MSRGKSKKLFNWLRFVEGEEGRRGGVAGEDEGGIKGILTFNRKKVRNEGGEREILDERGDEVGKWGDERSVERVKYGNFGAGIEVLRWRLVWKYTGLEKSQNFCGFLQSKVPPYGG